MAAFKIDGDFTKPAKVGAPRRSFPFEGDNESCLLEQDYMQFSANFRGLPLNTTHDVVRDAFLVEEGQQSSIGGGLVKWTRVYSKIPNPRNTYEEFVYEFPAFEACTPGTTLNCDYATGRDVYTLKVPSRVYHEFYLIGHSTVAGGTTALTSPTQIPIVAGQEYLSTAGPYPVASKLLNGTTTPTKSTYIGWANTHTTELVAEDSSVSQWRGNIWVRKTRYVIAR